MRGGLSRRRRIQQRRREKAKEREGEYLDRTCVVGTGVRGERLLLLFNQRLAQNKQNFMMIKANSYPDHHTDFGCSSPISNVPIITLHNVYFQTEWEEYVIDLREH